MRSWGTGLGVGLLALALASARAEEAAAIHEVQAGETLSAIAAHTLGDPSLWPAIYEANRDQIKDPARVYPGQRLMIPEVGPEEREEARREASARSAAPPPALP